MAQGTAAVAEERRARASARYVRMAPRKVRRVVDLIRGMEAREALSVLQFAPQAASEPVAKVLASAVANAEHNLQLDPESLVVAVAYVDEGPTAKRARSAKAAPARSAKAAPARSAKAAPATAAKATKAPAKAAGETEPTGASHAPRARKAAKKTAEPTGTVDGEPTETQPTGTLDAPTTMTAAADA